MMRSESSNYKLGRLDKVLVLKFVLTRTNRPRYRVQDGSWPNHKNFLIFSAPVFLCLEGGEMGRGDFVRFGEIWELVGDLGINLGFLGVGEEILWEGGRF